MRASTGDAVIFGYRFVECGGNVEEPSGAKLGRAGSLTLSNAAGEEGKVFEEGMKVFAPSPKRLDDTRKDRLPLSNGVPSFLVEFAEIRGAAGLGKGTLGVPLGQRITYGGIDKELFACWRNGKDVHDGVSGVL